MKISSPHIPENDDSMQNVDFFSLMNELSLLISTGKKSCDDIFSEAINGEILSTETEYRLTINNFIKGKIPHNKILHNSDEETYEKYINFFQTKYPPSSFNQFLFFVHIYSLGKIGHKTFTNLIFNFLNHNNPNFRLANSFEVNFLPLFMTSISRLSKTSSKYYDKKINEEYAIELVVGLTSFAATHANQKTGQFDLGKKLSKCFQCLSTGTISLADAKYWLSQYFPSAFYHKIDLLNDFRFLSPYRFPYEIIGCTDFRPMNKDKYSSQSAYEQYKNIAINRHSMRSLSPAALEIYERELFIISEIIALYCENQPITAIQLKPLFGKKGIDRIVKRFENGTASQELNILSKRFEKVKNDCIDYLNIYEQNQLIEHHNIQDIIRWTDFRCIFNILLRPLICSKYLEFPGTYHIHFDGIHQAMVAIAFVSEFINVYFGSERAQLLNHALAAFLPLFVDRRETVADKKNKINHSQAISGTQLVILTYLSEIAHIFASCGDVASIGLCQEENWFELPRFIKQDYTNNNFAQFITSMPSRLKNKEIFYQNPKPFNDNQQLDVNLLRLYNMDLILVKICQFLNLSASEKEFQFSNSTKMLKKKKIVSIIRPNPDENDASIIISSIFSIFYEI